MDELLARLAVEPGDRRAWGRVAGLDAAGRRRLVATIGREDRDRAVTALKAAVDRAVRAEPRTALALSGLLVAAAGDEGPLAALALRGRGTAAHFNGREDEARADFERAIALYTAAGDALGAARVRRSLMDVHLYAGRTEEALACAAAAEEVFVDRGEQRLLGQLRVNVGNVHLRRDEYRLARESYRSARELFTAVEDELALAITDFNLAVVELNGSRLDQAEDAFRSSRAVFERQGHAVHVADCDYMLAYLESRRGHFDTAVDGLERARTLYLENGKRSGVPLCDLDLAEIFVRLDARHDALDHARAAVSVFRREGPDYELARALALEGLALGRLGDEEASRRALDEAARLFGRLGNEASVAWIDLMHATSDLAKGRLGAVEAAAASAAERLASRDLVLLADMATVTLAEARLRRGRHDAAEAALAPLLAGDRAPRPFDGLVVSQALSLAAALARRRDDREGERRALERATAALHDAAGRVPSSDVRVAFFRDRHDVAERLALLLADRGNAAAALATLEAARERGALGGEPAGGDAELECARAHLDWLLGRHLDGEYGPATSSHDLRAPRVTVAEIRAAQDAVAAAARRARQAAGADPDPAGAGALADAAGDDVVLVFLVTGQGAAVLRLDDGGVEARRLDVSPERLACLADRVWLHLDKGRLGEAYLDRHGEGLRAAAGAALAELGEALLGPVLDPADTRGCVIVPCDPLLDLPFHALLLDGRPLLARRDVSYAPSVSVLARRRRARAARGRDARGRPGGDGTARAPVDGVGRDGPGGRPAAAGSAAEGPPILVAAAPRGGLPGTAGDARALRAAFGAGVTVLDGDEGGAELTTRARRGGLLHIASHGLYPARRPAFAGVLVGRHVLTAHEIRRRRLPFDLVTLAGCETGRQQGPDGTPAAGLARAFLQAGVSAVVASLWSVEDAAVATFMSRFYAALAAGRTARSALAEACREERTGAGHPSSWAAFTLFGDPDVTLPIPPRVSP